MLGILRSQVKVTNIQEKAYASTTPIEFYLVFVSSKGVLAEKMKYGKDRSFKVYSGLGLKHI